MAHPTILDDQPVGRAADKLAFDRYLLALTETVLLREGTAPFVVGLYGRWGSGKSSLLKMLEEWLKDDGQRDRYEVVCFSPWLYRQERSLLLPLLATLAKKRPAFESIVQEIVDFGPSLLRMLAKLGVEGLVDGLPLVSFLKSIRDKKAKAQDLVERIAVAVGAVTGDTKRLVFLIDDLDRCQDPAQVVGLLEQIKIFLHLERCLFFIAADREQVIRSIDTEFKGSGREYLDKFVQLAFELPSLGGHRLPNLPAVSDPRLRDFLQRLGEGYAGNPRRLKLLWNQAVVGLRLVQGELDRVTKLAHTASLELMLKWLVLKEGFGEDPYRYLQFEREAASRGDPGGPAELAQHVTFTDALGVKDPALIRFLWYDLWDPMSPRFGQPAILRLYAEASGEDIGRSRDYIESHAFNGQHEFERLHCVDADLSYGRYAGLRFVDCDFERARFENADLEGSLFRGCRLHDACFNGARIGRASFERCAGIDALSATEPGIYERIADAAVLAWREAGRPQPGWDVDGLARVYSAIYGLYPEGLGASAVRERLQAKAREL